MKILTSKKIILLKKSEIEFGKQVLEQYKQKEEACECLPKINKN